MYRAFFVLGTIEVMRTLVTRILWLAAAGALLYGGFVAYERWWDGDLSLVKERALSFVSDNTEGIQGQAIEKGSEVLETVKEEATKQVKGAISSVVGGAIESIGDTIVQYGQSVAGNSANESVVAPSGSGYQKPPPPVALSAKTGFPLSFAVNEGESYTATWGDGTSDEGEKGTEETILLRHAWETPGDYTMTLITKAASGTHTETFPVRIFE